MDVDLQNIIALNFSVFEVCTSNVHFSDVLEARHIIQLMHVYVNIRIFQPDNSDVHGGEAEVNITFKGCYILIFTEKECTNCFFI